MTFNASADTGAAINSTIAGLARLIYPAEAKHLADYDVVSNLPPGAAFRGPGGPPMAFALEQAVDEAAHPAEDRSDRAAQEMGHRSEPAAALRLGAAARRLEDCEGARPAERALSLRHWRRDRLLALSLAAEDSKVELAVENHRLVVSVAIQDIGTGSRTVLANTVAQEFDLEPHEVEVRIGDSALPVGPASGGSRTTASVVPPTLMAIEKLKAEIQRQGQPRRRPPARTRRGAT